MYAVLRRFLDQSALCVSAGDAILPLSGVTLDRFGEALLGPHVACLRLSKSTAPITSGDAVLVMSQPFPVHHATCYHTPGVDLWPPLQPSH